MGPAGSRSTYALPAWATSGGAMAIAGRTAAPSFGSDDMFGMKSSGSSGGSAATESMTQAGSVRLSVWLLRLAQLGF